jgi:RNA polymerase sigma-70 factor, ECF subfamily
MSDIPDPCAGEPREHQRMLVQSLFVQHTAALRGFLIALAPDFGLVDEVMQEVFLTVSAKAEQFQPGTSFPAWGRAIARLKLMEATRQGRKSPEPFPADLLDLLCAEEPEAASNADAELEHLAHCLGKLAPKARQAVRLRYDEGFFPDKIADRLGWTPEAVYVALSRARLFLRQCVERRLRGEQIV